MRPVFFVFLLSILGASVLSEVYCPNCRDSECDQENIPNEECNRSSAVLPGGLENIAINDVDSTFTCIYLEYTTDNISHKLSQCLLHNGEEDLCKEIETKLHENTNLTMCKVSEPSPTNPIITTAPTSAPIPSTTESPEENSSLSSQTPPALSTEDATTEASTESVTTEIITQTTTENVTTTELPDTTTETPLETTSSKGTDTTIPESPTTVRSTLPTASIPNATAPTRTTTIQTTEESTAATTDETTTDSVGPDESSGVIWNSGYIVLLVTLIGNRALNKFTIN